MMPQVPSELDRLFLLVPGEFALSALAGKEAFGGLLGGLSAGKVKERAGHRWVGVADVNQSQSREWKRACEVGEEESCS